MWSPLEHQVAGHAGVMEDESGDLVIKVSSADILSIESS
jgi:hypothetical protein